MLYLNNKRKSLPINKQSFHIWLNQFLYLLCQIAGLLAMIKCNCSLIERFTLSFLFSLLISIFYNTNKEIIINHYSK
jgi:hypothetical protein